MSEHRPESAQPLPEHVELDCVTLPAIPIIYALHDPDEGVQSWVFALPDGNAYIVSTNDDGNLVAQTTLDRVVNYWAPRRCADLVLVTT